MPEARRYSLRFTIATFVVVLLLTTVAGVLVIGLFLRSRTVAATAEALQGEVSTRITERIVERFAPVSGLLRGLCASAEAGRLSLEEGALLEQLVDRMRFEERLEWLAFIHPDGSGVGALHHEKGVMVVRLSVASQARIEIWNDDGSITPVPSRDMSNLQLVPWVANAQAADGPVWSKPYIRPYDGQPGRACSMAARRDAQALGVFGAGFGLGFVRTYLNSIKVGRTGAVFGVNQSTAEILTSPSEDALRRMGPAIDEAIAGLPKGVGGLTPGALHSVPVKHDGVAFRVGLSFQNPEGLPSWVHAIVVPEDELIGYFGGYLVTGLIAVAILLAVAIALAQLLSRRISRSLDAIAQDLRKVGDFELTERPATASIISEVAVVSDATERMKASLRSFGRYVPTDLVRDLLTEGQEARLDGVERPLTLFFSDIAGFTTSSEGMGPSALVDALGEYLDVVCRAVKSSAGTIDKFIGDGVMAFFNAPRDDEDHAANGCRAALAVQAALAAAGPGWRAAGLPDFTTRIGLHTAEVVVGNIGTPERFAYTVIGDGVNLAARLESLNKAYGTLILGSQELRDAAGEGFVWRAIDRTAVVGRAAGGTVHELVGLAGEVDASTLQRVEAYEQAFTLYLERHFVEARDAFEALASEDGPAATLAARAAAYAEEPPPEGWTGVYVQTKK